MRSWYHRLVHPGWLDEGQQPDYRFSLANERTFLAWIRTVLALLAASVAVSQLLTHGRIDWGRHAIAIVLAAAALVLALNTYRRWGATERAMRRSGPLPAPSLLLLLALTTVLVGVGVLALVVFW
jgi:putative membrane protein